MIFKGISLNIRVILKLKNDKTNKYEIQKKSENSNHKLVMFFL